MVKKHGIPKQEFTYNVVIDSADLREYLKSGYMAIPRIIKRVWFNKDDLACQNVKCEPKVSEHVYIIQNSKWTMVNRDLFLETLILKLWTMLYDCYNSIVDLDQYKSSFVCEEMFLRTQTFISDFERFCEHGFTDTFIDLKQTVYSHVVYLTKKIKP